MHICRLSALHVPLQGLLFPEAGVKRPLDLVALAPELGVWMLLVALDESFNLLQAPDS